ncbi:hypothetical protein GCM10023238_10600 [Streptomyces heliomycini]
MLACPCRDRRHGRHRRLGGAVIEAIGQLNIGLGAESGIAIVILAIYLDRMTSALGTQVSPLGRRAAAKARAAQG